MSDIKPCPFCGDDARIGGGPYAQECFSIWCNNRDCRHHMDGNMNYAETVAKWNRRAPTHPAKDT